MSDSLLPTYNRQTVRFVRGEGPYLWDERGVQHLDAVSGIAVTGLGHAHPDLAEAICDQAKTLIHTSNLYGIPWQEKLGERLAALSGMEKVFFGNSGSEANEAAIKLARLHARRREIDRPKIAVMEHSFHGRTLAALSATGNTAIQQGFEPLLDGFERVPYGDIDALKALADDPAIAAVLLEPVQGEGGVRPAPEGYLAAVRELCDAQDWLMMVDEVQTGIARTGRWFGFQHEAGVLPDVMSLAKGLGNGVPIGACLTAGRATDLFGPGSHGSTFGGNPLVCRAAATVLDVIERDGLVARAEQLGEKIARRIREGLADESGCREVRGRGLMIGIELDRPAGELVARALKEGLLINVTAGSVVRLLPPLILSASQADLIADRVVGVIRDWYAAN
ncbi:MULTISPECIES: acetylornithine transaminase [unclassified Guyparkeria]|uniref:acetylornithine transaminase n=1 Tax=unclassified Guyparkeria TaxID=2626246 RepID=UPI0007337D7C|nr:MULTISPECIES: acetylornithine transaminase [unclassified Guyparkeria]KTG16125.1 acetylornithine aminotransferase [Guyparkeria sp. XI15]OAE84976.1 acetylornithine aminotransferase [Guyparkeria sp. WRN-7]